VGVIRKQTNNHAASKGVTSAGCEYVCMASNGLKGAAVPLLLGFAAGCLFSLPR
jgi:hypothetical protein